MQRAATGLLALMFLASAGVASLALHLCGMEGLVQRTCCCHEADQGPPAQLKPIDDCCGAVITTGEHPPVAPGSDQGGVDAPTLAIGSVTTNASHGERPEEPAWMPHARGSPGIHGPPLFVWNCSYLI